MALAGVTALDADLGYSAMLALDGKGTLPLPRAMAHYLQATTSCHQERMPLHLAGVFFPLCEADSASVAILAKFLVRLPVDDFPSDLFAFLARLVVLNTQHEGRTRICRELIGLASSKGLTNEVTEMLKAQVEFYANSTNWQRDTYSSERDLSSERRAAFRTLQSKLDKGSFAGQPAKALSAIVTSGARGHDLRLLIVEQGKRQRGADVTRYLDALCAMEGDGYYSYEGTLAAALCELLAVLPQRLLVERWIASGYAQYVIRTYPSLVVYDSDYRTAAKPLLELGCVPEEIRTDALLGILCKYGHKLPPRRLFELTGSFAHNSSACSVMSVLFSELNTVQGKAEDLTASNLPTDPVKLCSHIVHDAFGHADNRIRWRALHAFRLAVTLGSGPFVEAAVDLLHRNDCRLWMSARDWLLFALLHTSRKSPSLLAPHTSTFWALATDDDFPHAGHQELARRILEHVVAAVPSALDPEKRADLPALTALFPAYLTGKETRWVKRIAFDSGSMAWTQCPTGTHLSDTLLGSIVVMLPYMPRNGSAMNGI